MKNHFRLVAAVLCFAAIICGCRGAGLVAILVLSIGLGVFSLAESELSGCITLSSLTWRELSGRKFLMTVEGKIAQLASFVLLALYLFYS